MFFFLNIKVTHWKSIKIQKIKTKINEAQQQNSITLNKSLLVFGCIASHNFLDYIKHSPCVTIFLCV